jgi:peptide/nickel transport system substrate-binding protein
MIRQPPWQLYLFSLCLLINFFYFSLPCKADQGEGVLKFGVHVSAMGNLDPHFAAASQDRAFADMVFNGLLRYVPGNAPRIEPDLALDMPSFRMEGGKQIWSISLRRGVYFHPGPGTPAHELTADDVIFSLKKSADKKYCAYAGEYKGMAIKKQDDYGLEIILEEPISSILFFPKLTNYGGGFIISKKAVATMGYEGFKSHPIGTGPFAFKELLPGSKLALTANRQYFRGTPKLAGVEIVFVPEMKEREKGLKQGQLDVITGSAEKGWIETMEKDDTLQIDTHGVGEVGTIHLNTRMKPLDDIRVRRAIAYALGRDGFLNTTSPLLSGPVFSPVPAQFLPGGLSGKEARTLKIDFLQDFSKAKDLLREAGYPKGFSLDLVTSEKRVYQNYYFVMKEQLAKIGINCNITIETHSKMHKIIRNDPKPIVIYPAWRPNADVYLTRFFHSDAIIVKGLSPDTNFSHYDKIDKLIQAARLTIDPVAQVNLWIQAQIRILDDMAALPIMFTQQCYARKTYVDYGHSLVSTMALYPQFTENTTIKR